MDTNAHPSRKRVAVVGAGAAGKPTVDREEHDTESRPLGMSAAYALSLHPDLFSVTLFERSSCPGGMATSHPIDLAKFGADYVNDGVQGASPVFYNTYAMFDRLGFSASPVGMQVSFGRDHGDFWSNVFPSETIDRRVSIA